MIPDLEALIGDTLRDDPTIIALDARVAGELPRSFTRPWIRVTQLDASNATGSNDVEHLISYLVQLDCYAGSDITIGQAQASTLSRSARSVLFAMKGKKIDGTVITNVAFRNHARIPDLQFDPPRERYILDCEVYAHA